ncbi:MAG: hypothetical protein ABWX83_11510, partial [Luteibacter sp.]
LARDGSRPGHPVVIKIAPTGLSRCSSRVIGTLRASTLMRRASASPCSASTPAGASLRGV